MFLFVPMHHKIKIENVEVGHWYLLVLDMSKERAYVLDSLKGNSQEERIADSNKVLDFIDVWLGHSAFNLRYLYVKPNVSTFPIDYLDMREQGNTFDCGVYVIQYMRNIADFENMKNEAFANDIDPIRKKIVSWICMHNLNESW